MIKQRIVTFSVWCLAGVALATLALRIPTASSQTPSASTREASATFSEANVVQLFTPTTSTAPSITSFSLLGIIYTSPSANSKIIIQNGALPPQKLSLHGTLPNQGTITKIDKKWFEYSLNQQNHVMHLPETTPSATP